MEGVRTRILQRKEIRALLGMQECMEAVEEAFLHYGQGKLHAPKVLGMHCARGGFHIKAGMSGNYFVAKLNANFPGNPLLHQLPSIQGVIIVGDTENGRMLALLDSIEITIL